MKLFFPLITYLALFAGLACKSSHDSTRHTSPADSTASKSPAAAIAQNGSRVEAVVEQVQDLGDTQFNLKIFIVTSAPLSGTTTIAEEGQRMIVAPHYYADSTGKVNFEEPRNKRLLAAKKLQVGEGFKGKVVLNRWGGWDLTDVEEREK